MFEHPEDGVQELAHGSDQGLHLGFPARREVFAEGAQVELALDGDQSRHIEGSTQMFIASLGDADLFVH